MAKVPVTQYAVTWNPVTNHGQILVSVGGGSPSPVPVNSSEEFIMVMLMMSKSGVLFDTETKELDIPFRPVGT